MPHPNEVVIRKLYEAASSGDPTAIQSLFAPSIVWHEPGKNPTSGDYKGIEEFMGFFGRVCLEVRSVSKSTMSWRTTITPWALSQLRHSGAGRIGSEPRSTYSIWRRERLRSSGTTRATSTPRTSSGAEAGAHNASPRT